MLPSLNSISSVCFCESYPAERIRLEFTRLRSMFSPAPPTVVVGSSDDQFASLIVSVEPSAVNNRPPRRYRWRDRRRQCGVVLRGLQHRSSACPSGASALRLGEVGQGGGVVRTDARDPALQSFTPAARACLAA